MQTRDELSLGLYHLPRWLSIVIVVLGAMSVAFFSLPLLPDFSLRFAPSLPGSVPTVLGALWGVAAFVAMIYLARAILQHLRRRERLYAALDAWRLLCCGAIFYYIEGQLFPILPATGIVFVCSMVCVLLTGLGLPYVSNWYSRQHAHATTPR